MQRPDNRLDVIPNCMNCHNGEPLGRFVHCLDAVARRKYGVKHLIRERFICNYHRKENKNG